jgi:hypothetical protein
VGLERMPGWGIMARDFVILWTCSPLSLEFFKCKDTSRMLSVGMILNLDVVFFQLRSGWCRLGGKRIDRDLS